MNVLILGAGAIGGYYGARLIEAGADVTFLVRAQRAAIIARDGLTINSVLGNFKQAVTTITQDQVTTDYDVILLTCKAYDLQGAIEAIKPAMGSHTVIVPFLNGLHAYDQLDATFGKQHVLGGIAYIATMLDKEGVIVHYGPGDTVILGARTPEGTKQASALHALLTGSPGVRALSPHIDQALWNKWVMIASGALMTTLMRGTVGEIMATQDGPALMQRAMAECRAVANASGFTLPDDVVANMEKLLLDVQSTWAASMARDINQQATRLEADDIVGDMVRRAVHFGQDAPLAQAAYAHLQIYQQQRAQA